MKPNWFIALPVPAESWFAERVAAHPQPSVRLFHPDDLHLTVAFLGAVDEAAARQAWDLATLWRQGPFRISFGEVIGMGPPAQYSALSALLVRGRDEAEAGMRACRDPMLSAAKSRPELHPIKAHVTLGRPRRDARPAERNAALAWALQLPLQDVELELSEIALYTWPEDRRERQFRTVERQALPAAG